MSIEMNPTYSSPYRVYVEMQEREELITGMVEKTVNLLREKDTAWVHNILKDKEHYEDSLKSMTFFIPFIESNAGSLVKCLGSEGLFTEEEEKLLGDLYFHQSLTMNLFNESFIADSWFSREN